MGKSNRKRDYSAENARRKANGKPRDYKAEYAKRKMQGIAKGFTPSQAVGKPRKGELTKTDRAAILNNPHASALINRIYRDLDGEERSKGIELFKRAKREGFKRRSGSKEPPTALDRLLELLTEPDDSSDYGLGISPPTVDLRRQFASGVYSR